MYEQNEELPSIDEYMELRVRCGLSPKTREAATVGLRNTLFATSIRGGGHLVGMGRLIGNGGCHFQIVDVAVLPIHQ